MKNLKILLLCAIFILLLGCGPTPVQRYDAALVQAPKNSRVVQDAIYSNWFYILTTNGAVFIYKQEQGTTNLTSRHPIFDEPIYVPLTVIIKQKGGEWQRDL